MLFSMLHANNIWQMWIATDPRKIQHSNVDGHNLWFLDFGMHAISHKELTYYFAQNYELLVGDSGNS